MPNKGFHVGSAMPAKLIKIYAPELTFRRKPCVWLYKEETDQILLVGLNNKDTDVSIAIFSLQHSKFELRTYHQILKSLQEKYKNSLASLVKANLSTNSNHQNANVLIELRYADLSNLENISVENRPNYAMSILISPFSKCLEDLKIPKELILEIPENSEINFPISTEQLDNIFLRDKQHNKPLNENATPYSTLSGTFKVVPHKQIKKNNQDSAFEQPNSNNSNMPSQQAQISQHSKVHLLEQQMHFEWAELKKQQFVLEQRRKDYQLLQQQEQRARFFNSSANNTFSHEISTYNQPMQIPEQMVQNTFDLKKCFVQNLQLVTRSLTFLSIPRIINYSHSNKIDFVIEDKKQISLLPYIIKAAASPDYSQNIQSLEADCKSLDTDKYLYIVSLIFLKTEMRYQIMPPIDCSLSELLDRTNDLTNKNKALQESNDLKNGIIQQLLDQLMPLILKEKQTSITTNPYDANAECFNYPVNGTGFFDAEEPPPKSPKISEQHTKIDPTNDIKTITNLINSSPLFNNSAFMPSLSPSSEVNHIATDNITLTKF